MGFKTPAFSGLFPSLILKPTWFKVRTYLAVYTITFGFINTMNAFNAHASNISHNTASNHLTNYCHASSHPAPNNLWRYPERGLLVRKRKHVASLFLLEIIISMIFHNFQHLNRRNRVRKQSTTSTSPRRHRSLRFKNSLCSWWLKQEACFQCSPFTPR